MRIYRVVALCLGFGLALSACSSGGGGGPTKIGDLKIGDCFNHDAEATSVDVVACSEPHDFEVYLFVRLEDIMLSDAILFEEWENYTGEVYDSTKVNSMLLTFTSDGDGPDMVVSSHNLEGKSTGSIKAN